MTFETHPTKPPNQLGGESRSFPSSSWDSKTSKRTVLTPWSQGKMTTRTVTTSLIPAAQQSVVADITNQTICGCSLSANSREIVFDRKAAYQNDHVASRYCEALLVMMIRCQVLLETMGDYDEITVLRRQLQYYVSVSTRFRHNLK